MAEKYYNKKELEVNSWINSLGFRTEMQVPFGRKCVDIEIPELGLIIEVDGPQHYKKATFKRDKYLYDNFDITNILHVSSNITHEEFNDIFNGELNEEKRIG